MSARVVWDEKEYLPKKYTRYTTESGILIEQPDENNESEPNFSVELIEKGENEDEIRFKPIDAPPETGILHRHTKYVFLWSNETYFTKNKFRRYYYTISDFYRNFSSRTTLDSSYKDLSDFPYHTFGDNRTGSRTITEEPLTPGPYWVNFRIQYTKPNGDVRGHGSFNAWPWIVPIRISHFKVIPKEKTDGFYLNITYNIRGREGAGNQQSNNFSERGFQAFFPDLIARNTSPERRESLNEFVDYRGEISFTFEIENEDGNTIIERITLKSGEVSTEFKIPSIINPFAPVYISAKPYYNGSSLMRNIMTKDSQFSKPAYSVNNTSFGYDRKTRVLFENNTFLKFKYLPLLAIQRTSDLLRLKLIGQVKFESNINVVLEYGYFFHNSPINLDRIFEILKNSPNRIPNRRQKVFNTNGSGYVEINENLTRNTFDRWNSNTESFVKFNQDKFVNIHDFSEIITVVVLNFNNPNLENVIISHNTSIENYFRIRDFELEYSSPEYIPRFNPIIEYPYIIESTEPDFIRDKTYIDIEFFDTTKEENIISRVYGEKLNFITDNLSDAEVIDNGNYGIIRETVRNTTRRLKAYNFELDKVPLRFEYLKTNEIDRIFNVVFTVINNGGDEFYFLSKRTSERSLSPVLFPPEIELLHIVNNERDEDIRVTYKLKTYVDEIEFTLSDDDGEISTKTETETLETFDTEPRIVILDYTDKALNFDEFKLEVIAKNTLGGDESTQEIIRDISNIKARPTLDSIEFVSPTDVKYTFDVCKNFVDFVNNEQLDVKIKFYPREDELQASELSGVPNGDDIRFTQTFDYSGYSGLKHKESLDFKVEVIFDGSPFDSSTISKEYKLMIPTFSSSFTVDGTNDLTNRINVSDLNVSVDSEMFYSSNSIEYERITYTVTLEFSDYSDSFPTDIIKPTNNSNINKTYPFYYSDEATIKVKLEYNGVEGSITEENSITTPIQPFELILFNVVEANEDYTSSLTRIRGEIQYIGRIDRYDISIVDTTEGLELDNRSVTVNQDVNSVFKNLENNISYPINRDEIRDTVNIFREQVTFDISSSADFDNIVLRATTQFDGKSIELVEIDVPLEVPRINELNLSISNPLFINIEFGVEDVDIWKNVPSPAAIIYEYVSETDIDINTLSPEDYTRIKTCRFDSQDIQDRIITKTSDTYLVNSYRTVDISNNYYYSYYVHLQVENEVGDIIELSQGAPIQKKIETNIINLTSFNVDFNFNNSPIRFGIIESSSTTDPNDIFNLSSKPTYAPSFYDFETSKVEYITTYKHNGTTNNPEQIYTSTSTPSTDNGRFPVNNNLERVSDTSSVDIEIKVNYDEQIQNIPVKTFELDTFITPSSIDNLTTQKINSEVSATQFTRFQFEHTGIVEDFLITAFSFDEGTEDISKVVPGNFEIGQDTSSTVISYDVKVEEVFIEDDVCYQIIPRFYGVEGAVVEKLESFTFGATNVVFSLYTPTVAFYQFDISGELHRERTKDIGIYIGVSDNEIEEPLEIDSNDNLAVFRDSQGQLQQFKRPYRPNDDVETLEDISSIDNIFSNIDVTDLCNNLSITWEAGKYYYFSIAPIVDISQLVAPNTLEIIPVASPPSHTTTIQLPDLSGVDISLVFHQNYTKHWDGYTYDWDVSYSPDIELSRFLIDPSKNTNVMEIQYRIWNGWANFLNFEVYDGSLNKSEISSLEPDISFLIDVNQIYTHEPEDGTDFSNNKGLRFSPREYGLNIYETVSAEQYLQSGKYAPNTLSNLPPQEIIVNDDETGTGDSSYNLYTLEGHYLFSYTDTSNITVFVRPERDNFISKEETLVAIPTPVKPFPVNINALNARDLFNIQEERIIHIYLTEYPFEEFEFNTDNIRFFITAKDISNDDFLTLTEDDIQLDNYEISVDSTPILYDPSANPVVFSFDASYGLIDAGNDIDISVVVQYFNVDSDITTIDVKTASEKPIFDASSIPNPVTNPTQDPKQIEIDLSFDTSINPDIIDMFAFVSSSEIDDINTINDASYTLWKRVPESEYELNDNIVRINTYREDVGLREFTYYYFRFQGTYGNGITDVSSDPVEFYVEELLKRPTISMEFVGRDVSDIYLNEFFNLQTETITSTGNLVNQLVYPLNRITISFEDVSFTQRYEFDFHYNDGEKIIVASVEDLPFVGDFHEDVRLIADITPQYDNIDLSSSATQTISAETLIVSELLVTGFNKNKNRQTNVQLDWIPILFGNGYKIQRYVQPSLLPDPSYGLLNTLDITTTPNVNRYTDRTPPRFNGKLVRFDPYLYYSVQTRYSVGDPTVEKFSDSALIYYFEQDMGCICPVPGIPTKLDNSTVKRQLSRNRRIAHKLKFGKYTSGL